MNAKDPELIDRFIALRARRITYAAIESQIGVNRKTLVRWSRQFAQRLANERAIEDESFAESLKNSQRARLEQACSLHQRVLEELGHRKLEEIPTASLALLAYRLEKHIPLQNGAIKFSEPFTHENIAAGDIPPTVVSWEG